MKWIRPILVFLMLFIALNAAQAQRYERNQNEDNKKNSKEDFSKRNLKDRLVFGGNLGLSFGTFTNIHLSPKVGYRMTEKWMAGIGATYQYFKFRGYDGNQIYGGQMFTNYRLFKQFVILGEIEYLNVPYQSRFPFDEDGRIWQPGTFLGAAYRQQLGGKVYADIELKYNFSYRRGLSPYPNPYVFNVAFYVF